MKILICLLAACCSLGAAATSSTLQWYRGNTHNHTIVSDGDNSPSVVAEWYLNHGYDFLVITDHNIFNDVPPLQSEMNALVAQKGRKPFLLIPGEEISDNFMQGTQKLPLHVCGVNTQAAR